MNIEEKRNYALRLIKKYPNSIPIVFKKSGKDTPDIDKTKFIVPRDIVSMEYEMEGVEEFYTTLGLAEKGYFKLIQAGLKPETARSVLPNATATEIIVTGDLNQWDRFFHLRCDEHAQIDIRELAVEIKKIIYG